MAIEDMQVKRHCDGRGVKSVRVDIGAGRYVQIEEEASQKLNVKLGTDSQVATLGVDGRSVCDFVRAINLLRIHMPEARR